MDFPSLMLLTISIALLAPIALTLRARQTAIPRRDVALLGAFSSRSGLGSLATTLT